LLIGGIVVLILAAAVAGGAWWYFTLRERPPEWDRLPSLALAAPAGDAFREDTPWLTLQLAPAKPDAANSMRLALLSQNGTPVPSAASVPQIAGLTAAPIAADSASLSLTVQPEPASADALVAEAPFDQGGWWRLRVAVDGEEDQPEFYLLFPDPNINGPGAVPTSGSSPEGEALFQRGMDAIHALKSVRYTQWLADGRGNAGISEHAVSAGGDGKPTGFTYRAPGGMEAVVIGSTRWIRLPGDLGWTRQEGAASVPPSQWGEEYAGATGFTILGEETIDGAQTQILAFVVPEVIEPRRQTAAWYLWWVDVASGHVRREAMVSRSHYMLNKFSDFDVPVTLEPPETQATPAAGTPAP
jgi:hypothetical protein